MTQPRTLIDLQTRAAPALHNPVLVEIARLHKPTPSYDLAMTAYNDAALAKATRWLAMIRRDHGEQAFTACLTKKT